MVVNTASIAFSIHGSVPAQQQATQPLPTRYSDASPSTDHCSDIGSTHRKMPFDRGDTSSIRAGPGGATTNPGFDEPSLVGGQAPCETLGDPFATGPVGATTSPGSSKPFVGPVGPTPLAHTSPSSKGTTVGTTQVPRARALCDIAAVRWGGSTSTTPLLSVWGSNVVQSPGAA